ncbi:hypothetical protein A2U01_0072581, partial [Trifolium medium]|nr:hypothetical protein [Trifolium medium]
GRQDFVQCQAEEQVEHEAKEEEQLVHEDGEQEVVVQQHWPGGPFDTSGGRCT